MRRRNAVLLALVASALALLAATTVVPGGARAQEPPAARRVADAEDPVLAAIALSGELLDDGDADTVLLGRSDVFADDLAATGATGGGTVLLLTDPGRPLRPEVAAEIDRVLGAPRGCSAASPDGDPEVLLLGGTAAVDRAVAEELEADGRCVRRAQGASRVETSVAVARQVDDPAPRLLVARSDDWADAAAVSAYAAATRTPVVVTQRDALHSVVNAFLHERAGQLEEVVLLGGEAALDAAVFDAVRGALPDTVTVRRVAGAARDATAVAIVEELWLAAGLPLRGYALANGYAPTGWAYAIAVGALAADEATPVLYAQQRSLPPATAAQLDARPVDAVVLVGPASLVADDVLAGGPGPQPTDTEPGAPDLDAVRVELEEVALLDAPIDLVVRPETGELYVAERTGFVRRLGVDGAVSAPVLDLSASTTTDSERGLLGIAWSPDGAYLYTSSTDTRGDTRLDEFGARDDGSLDPASRRLVLQVDQPASNHNGGDVAFGPDGFLYLALGDGGGSDDEFDQAQDTSTLLGSILRLDPRGGSTGAAYAVPPDNPFVGRDGADEIWAYGLRNPWRIAFDAATGDLWIGDVGQGAKEEVDVLAPGEAGVNLGWSFYEGTDVFCCGPRAGQAAPPTKLPIHEYANASGTCAITGGVVYRGTAIPALRGAYLFGDFCAGDVTALAAEDGRAVDVRALGTDVPSLVSFGEDGDGEVYVLSLAGAVHRVVQV